MEEDYKKKMQERENRLFELQMKLKNIEQEGIIEQENKRLIAEEQITNENRILLSQLQNQGLDGKGIMIFQRDRDKFFSISNTNEVIELVISGDKGEWIKYKYIACKIILIESDQGLLFAYPDPPFIV